MTARRPPPGDSAPTPAPGPVPADPTHGPDRYIRCPPPSECALGWEWEVTVRVEAVAKLARAEIAKARAELAAATARFAAEQAAYVEELDAATAQVDELRAAGGLLHDKCMEAWQERDELRTSAAECERALVEARAEFDRRGAELAALRRQAADELSREGQGMGLDGESVIEWGYRDKVVLRTVVTTPWTQVPAEEADDE